MHVVKLGAPQPTDSEDELQLGDATGALATRSSSQTVSKSGHARWQEFRTENINVGVHNTSNRPRQGFPGPFRLTHSVLAAT